MHGASIFGFVSAFVTLHFVRFVDFVRFVHKIFWTPSKRVGRLRFGLLTVLSNTRSTKVLHHASCIMHQASCIMPHASQVGGWDLLC